MERRIDLHFRVSYEPRALRPWLAAALLLLSAGELGSENVTLTTYYPAPSGMYTQMVVTGKTILARDGNRVGIGTDTPQEKLDLGNNWMTPSYDVTANTNVGITWYTPSPTSYGIYRTAGAWTAGTYQQLKTQFDTGIILQPGPTGSDGYAKSYVDIGGGGKGLRVTRGNITVPNGNLSVAGTAPGTQPYVYINGSGASCGSSATNNGSCAPGRFATWTPGVYVDNSFWGAGPSLNFTTVATPLGNQTNITTTAPTYYCCLK